MKKVMYVLVGLLFGVPFVSGGPTHKTYCKNNPAENTKVCVMKSNGHGADCVVRTCGGWFYPDCDCYGTGVEE